MGLQKSLFVSIFVHTAIFVCVGSPSPFHLILGSNAISLEPSISIKILEAETVSKVAVRTARQVKEAEPNQLVAKMTSSGESESSTLPAEASSANWLQSQVRYPQEALEKNQQGQARFNLIYDENGELKSLEIAEAPIASSLKRETLRLKKVIEENRARFSAKHFANEQVVLPLVFRIMK